MTELPEVQPFTAATEVARGERFGFGENWSRFLAVVDDERIESAVDSLREMLGVDSLAGKSFLDIGSGSGLFSLAAHRLGATVVSFDFDPRSVACTQELRERFGSADQQRWRVEQGSVLDAAYVASLGTHDIVYSWGVLHHTGQMWQALDHATMAVKPGGTLFIAIYNTEPFWSEFYTVVKRNYVASPRGVQHLIAGTYMGAQIARGLLWDILHLRDPRYRYRERKQTRGMSTFYDWIDWIGGYPFETATVEEIVTFHREHGFIEHRVVPDLGQGCNQFVFHRG